MKKPDLNSPVFLYFESGSGFSDRCDAGIDRDVCAVHSGSLSMQIEFKIDHRPEKQTVG